MFQNIAETAKEESTCDPPQKRHSMSSSKPRAIFSCLTCRKRKVKCDHLQPICSACKRGSHTCIYASGEPSNSRVTKSSFQPSQKSGGLYDRLDRLEVLLSQAIKSGRLNAAVSPAPEIQPTHSNYDPSVTPERPERAEVLPMSPSEVKISSDGQNGTLLLEDGESHFASSMHWAFLADEIHDIKAMLESNSSDEPLKDQSSSSIVQPILFGLYSSTSGPALGSYDLISLLEPKENRRQILEIFFFNVDPMVRILHRPTTEKSFDRMIASEHPLALAICYSAIFSMEPSSVLQTFSLTKEHWLANCGQALESSFIKSKLLTTSSLEVLQAFVLYITLHCREDDPGKVWTLLGVVTRIAISQGIHRDPCLFPSGLIDEVTVEIRRRTWHHICHLDYRISESKGQEPVILEVNFTTLLPRNVDDEDLHVGKPPSNHQSEAGGFTNMTIQLIRFEQLGCLRGIVQRSYALERVVTAGNHGDRVIDLVAESRSFLQDSHMIIAETQERFNRLYLKFCDPAIPTQKFGIGLVQLGIGKAHLLTWIRVPRECRDSVFTPEMRQNIFASSLIILELFNQASLERDSVPFRWYMSGHSCFQAIMHLLAELRDHEYPPSFRLRALKALRIIREFRGQSSSTIWRVVTRLIDRTIANQRLNQFQSDTNLFPHKIGSPVENQSGYLRPNPIIEAQENTYNTPSPVPSANSYVASGVQYTSPISYMDADSPLNNFDWASWNLDPAEFNL